MSLVSEKDTNVGSDSVQDSLQPLRRIDDDKLAELGYKSEFKREFSVSFYCSYVSTLSDFVIAL